MTKTFENKDLLSSIVGKNIVSAVVAKDIWIDYIHEIVITFEDDTKLTVTQNDEDRWNYGGTYLSIEVT